MMNRDTLEVPRAWLGGCYITYPPYTSDLVSSDYHLFLSMSNDLAGEELASIKACENDDDEPFIHMSSTVLGNFPIKKSENPGVCLQSHPRMLSLSHWK